MRDQAKNDIPKRDAHSTGVNSQTNSGANEALTQSKGRGKDGKEQAGSLAGRALNTGNSNTFD